MSAKGILFVIVQLFLFLIFAGIPGGYAANFWWQFTAFIFVLSGTIFTTAGISKQGTALSPFPVPKKDSKLVTGGIYKWIRHPIYSGLLLTATGITVYSLNFPRAVITCLLLVLFYYKSVYEESLLVQQFPDYSDYQNKTGRFVPNIFRK